MTAVRRDKALTSNVTVTSKLVWEHVHELAHHALAGGAGRYTVRGCLRGQIRKALAVGNPTDYIALSAALFLDGALVEGSEVIIVVSRQDPVGVDIATACPPWEFEWDGVGAGLLEVRVRALYVPDRDNTSDIVRLASDEHGRTWFNVDRVPPPA